MGHAMLTDPARLKSSNFEVCMNLDAPSCKSYPTYNLPDLPCSPSGVLCELNISVHDNSSSNAIELQIIKGMLCATQIVNDDHEIFAALSLLPS